jgi:hypothetical protein
MQSCGNQKVAAFYMAQALEAALLMLLQKQQD